MIQNCQIICRNCENCTPEWVTEDIKKYLAALEYWEMVRAESEKGSGRCGLAERMIAIYVRKIMQLKEAAC